MPSRTYAIDPHNDRQIYMKGLSKICFRCRLHIGWNSIFLINYRGISTRRCSLVKPVRPAGWLVQTEVL